MKEIKFLRFLLMICPLQSLSNASDLQTKVGKGNKHLHVIKINLNKELITYYFLNQ